MDLNNTKHADLHAVCFVLTLIDDVAKVCLLKHRFRVHFIGCGEEVDFILLFDPF